MISLQCYLFRTVVSQTAGKLSTSQWVHRVKEPLSGVVGGHKYKSGQHGIKNSVCLFRVTVANLVREKKYGISEDRGGK